MLRQVAQISKQHILKAGCFNNYRNHSTNKSTVDTDEVKHFKEFAAVWWDEKGAIRPLHLMNNIRVPFIQDSIMHGSVDNPDCGRKELLKNMKLLDVGCGGGILSEALAKLGLQVTGIDAAKDLIEVAKRHASDNQDLQNLSYIWTTVEEISNKYENHFDVVVASEIVEHVSDVEGFVSECVKCLKPGGSMIVTTVNKTTAAKVYVIKILEYLEVIAPGTHTYEKFVPPSYLQTILEKNSCQTIRLQGAFYNCMTHAWSLTTSTSIFYLLHAKEM